MLAVSVWPMEVVYTAIKSLPIPLQKQLLGGCTIDMPRKMLLLGTYSFPCNTL